MAAPEPFAEMPDFSLAPRAPSIHDPTATLPAPEPGGPVAKSIPTASPAMPKFSGKLRVQPL
jgi:hypothetical protein